VAGRGTGRAPYWAAVHLISGALAYRAYLNGRLLTLGVTDQTTIPLADFLDLVESLIADAMASGAAHASTKLREAIAAQVSLTPDRATWGMDLDSVEWPEPAFPAYDQPTE
jgi:hypothetical protein